MSDENYSVPLWKSKRYLVVFLAFLGYINLYTMRVNLSVAIVAMTDQSAKNGTEMIFDWDAKTRGFILGSFFYGYIFTQFVGGLAATKFGGNIVFGGGIFVTALMCLITPWLTELGDVTGIVIIRIIQGVAGGLSFPSCHALFAKWAPENERSRMASLALSGYLFGTVLANMCSGVLAVQYGWPSIFYVFGTISIVWYAVWVFFVRFSPENDRFISDSEKRYILSHSGTANNQVKTKVPWKKMFTSIPVYAITVAHFSSNWGFYTLLTQLPSYLRDTFNFHLETTGFISALPYLTLGLLLAFAGYLADELKVKRILSLTLIRKVFTSASFMMQGLALIATAYSTDSTWCVIFVTISVASGAFSLSGFMVNPLDIAPQYASIVLGISNTFSTLPGIVSPILTGFIVSVSHAFGWRIVFFISAGIYATGAILYWLFGSGEVQPWAIQNKIQTQNGQVKQQTNGEIKCDI